MRGLSNKVAVVTGGAQGLGEAIVQRLSEEGCTVWLLDINELGAQVAQRISEQTRNPVYFEQVDISKEKEIQHALANIKTKTAQVHVLVNNAAAFIFKGIEATNQDWNQILDVNIKGTSMVTQHIVPLMKNVEGGGSIINLSSISGFIAQSQFATYNATKFAIRGLTKCWAMDLAQDRIRVNSVCPGYFRTSAFENSCKALGLDIEEEDARVSSMHILGRQGRPEELAGVVAFLASDDSTFMTGSDVVVDGGYLAK